MLRYYQRVTNAQIKASKGVKYVAGTHGPPKKWDKAKLACHTKDCDEDFWLYDGDRRYCEAHWFRRNAKEQELSAETVKHLLSLAG
jgi:hypothetical protein